MKQVLSLLPLSFSSFARAQYGSPDSSTSSNAATTATSSAAAQTTNSHDVDVGKDGALSYSPDTVTAAVGDTVEFHFYPLNHSVVQSDFGNPCQPSNNGIFSGFFPVGSGESDSIFTITINDTQPIWLYCAQTVESHCQSGMSMVINAPADGPDTLAAYRSAAKGAKMSTSPLQVNGGVVGANPETTNSSASSSGTGSGTATASAKPSIASGVAWEGRSTNWQALGGSVIGMWLCAALLA